MGTGDLFLKLDVSENVSGIYDGDLSRDEILANPIKRPILEINMAHQTGEIRISKELTEYIEKLGEMRKIVEANENTYKRTRIYQIFMELLDPASKIISEYSILMKNSKYVINEMVDICKAYYILADVNPSIVRAKSKKDPQEEFFEKDIEMKKSIATEENTDKVVFNS